MPEEKQKFESNTLWIKAQEVSRKALQTGALQPIPTDYEFVSQDGFQFLIRILSNIKRKIQATKEQKKIGKNPFLPYEEELFVADISSTHVCILNKYNVVDNHLLIITKEFQEQESLLTLADFEAMWITLKGIQSTNTLTFYNSGRLAGASQPHKHLQVIPLPFTPNNEGILLTQAIDGAEFQGDFGMNPNLPFVHAIAKLHNIVRENSIDTAKIILEYYFELLKKVNLKPQENKQIGSYNMLATKEYLIIIPRLQERSQSISINSLGFAGSLLVSNSEKMEIIKKIGPLTLLTNVGVRINS